MMYSMYIVSPIEYYTENEENGQAVTIHWTGLLDWNTGLEFFPFLDKFLCFLVTFKYLTPN